MLREATYYSRMAIGLWEFLRTPPYRDPASVVKAHLDNRESAFLATARSAVFGNPSNPYSHMFRLAGCEYGGLEAKSSPGGSGKTLVAVQSEGVDPTHDEFKGLQPLLRHGVEIPTSTGSFANRNSGHSLEQVSSGSRSRGTQSTLPAALIIYREAVRRLLLPRRSPRRHLLPRRRRLRLLRPRLRHPLHRLPEEEAEEEAAVLAAEAVKCARTRCTSPGRSFSYGSSRSS